MAKAGHDRATLSCFFEAVGTGTMPADPACDAAGWIAEEARARCPDVIVCLDPFHIARLATDALDVVRRETWNTARRDGMKAQAAT